ncbi:hypothetical protein GQ457_07G003930 [Hibiscus cannabinus]
MLIIRMKDKSMSDLLIKSGDDFISIRNGSKYINIRNIYCGSDHGIIIGSLGIMGKTKKNEFVHVRNVSFYGTVNGGHGYARNVRFERITSYASTRPIVIDQFYCPHNHCKDQVSYLTAFNHPYAEPS